MTDLYIGDREIILPLRDGLRFGLPGRDPHRSPLMPRNTSKNATGKPGSKKISSAPNMMGASLAMMNGLMGSLGVLANSARRVGGTA